ncbi:MAG: GlsB/YeaQ/YmgE family stress response membrane protein [Planctomycetota bacterium]|nr:GlsB/YeaQ/YmgE family stress response membrane protein [Planctomycetota bacterium]
MPNIDAEYSQLLHQWATDALTWIGFGTLVGLAAKALMPGRDPGGSIVTVLMGIGGSIIGCATLMYLSDGARATPISIIGFLVATAGAFILLFFYRLLNGNIIDEGGAPRRATRPPSYKRRRTAVPHYED